MTEREKLLLVILAAVAATAGVIKLQPLGIRQNNPGNIRFNPANNWNGQTGAGSGYSIFSELRYGIRAAGKLLRNYQSRYGLDTIAALIQRWAPQSENPTDAYIANVARWMGARADSPLDLQNDAVLESMLAAIFRQENGTQASGTDWITREEIRQGIALI